MSVGSQEAVVSPGECQPAGSSGPPLEPALSATPLSAVEDEEPVSQFSVYQLHFAKLARGCQPSPSFVDQKVVSKQLRLQPDKKHRLDLLFSHTDHKALLLLAKPTVNKCLKSTSTEEYPFAALIDTSRLAIANFPDATDNLVTFWFEHQRKPGHAGPPTIVYHVVECASVEEAHALITCFTAAKRSASQSVDSGVGHPEASSRSSLSSTSSSSSENVPEEVDPPQIYEASQLGHGVVRGSPGQVDISTLAKPHLGKRKTNQRVRLTFFKTEVKVDRVPAQDSTLRCCRPNSMAVLFEQVRRVELGQREAQPPTTIVAIYIGQSGGRSSTVGRLNYVLYEFVDYTEACRAYDLISQGIGNPPSYTGLDQLEQPVAPEEADVSAVEVEATHTPVVTSMPPQCDAAGQVGCNATSADELVRQLGGEHVVFFDDKLRTTRRGSMFMYARQFPVGQPESAQVSDDAQSPSGPKIVDDKKVGP